MCVCRLLDSGKLKMIQCEILCAKNGTTAFAPVPDSIVLLSQVMLRFVLVTFKNCIIMLLLV